MVVTPSKFEREVLEELRQQHAADGAPTVVRARVLRRVFASTAVAQKPVSSTQRAALLFVAAGAAAALAWLGLKRQTADLPPIADASRAPTFTAGPNDLLQAASEPATVRRDEGTRCFAARGNDGLVSNFENHSLQTAFRDGRFSTWYHFRSSDAEEPEALPLTFIETVGGASSGWALRAKGLAAEGWGSIVGFSLRGSMCYNSSAYAGVRFRARGEGEVQVRLLTSASTPKRLGGDCETGCWHAAQHRVVLSGAFENYALGWQQFVFPEGSGNLQQLTMIEFARKASAKPYELLLDDVALIHGSAVHAVSAAADPGETR